MSLNKLTIAECIQGIEKKHFSITELVQDHIKQIEKFEYINAFTSYNQAALEQAKQLDQSGNLNKNKLFGIPISVKDIFCTKNMKTTCGSKMLANFFPDYDATCITKLNQAIILGKTNMDEFAMGSSTTTSIFKSTVNPWSEKNTYLTSGGSSGGSAASVSALMSMASLGTDTGGSVRQPAAFTGTVGLKPSYGRISRWGVIAFASSLDTVGIFSRCVQDAAIVLQEIQGFDEKDSTSKNIKGNNLEENLDKSIKNLRIGVIKELEKVSLSDCVAQSNQRFIKCAQELGCTISDISIDSMHYALATYYILSSCEASSNLSRYDGMRYGHRSKQDKCFESLVEHTRAEGFCDEVKNRILMGTYLLSHGFIDDYYIKAQKIRRKIFNQFQEAFQHVDVIITPTCPTTAFAIDQISDDPVDMYNNDILTIMANLAGIPCISIPSGLSKEGLPIGMQIMGPMHSEKLILQVAHNMEKSIKFNPYPKQIL